MTLEETPKPTERLQQILSPSGSVVNISDKNIKKVKSYRQDRDQRLRDVWMEKA